MVCLRSPEFYLNKGMKKVQDNSCAFFNSVI